MKIYLVRHGQCNSNLRKVYNSKNEDINQTGIEQATLLREIIKELNLDIIYSSPLLRTRHTTEILNVNNNKVILDDRLIERDSGRLQGTAYAKTDREEYWNYYTKTKCADEEDIREFFDRVASFLDELKTKDYKSVLIVAHNGVSKAFSAYFEGIPEDGRLLNRGIDNTEIKEYEL